MIIKNMYFILVIPIYNKNKITNYKKGYIVNNKECKKQLMRFIIHGFASAHAETAVKL